MKVPDSDLDNITQEEIDKFKDLLKSDSIPKSQENFYTPSDINYKLNDSQIYKPTLMDNFFNYMGTCYPFNYLK